MTWVTSHILRGSCFQIFLGSISSGFPHRLQCICGGRWVIMKIFLATQYMLNNSSGLLATSWQLFYKSQNFLLSHTFFLSIKRYHWLLLNWKIEYQFAFFFIVTMKNICSFILFCKRNGSGIFTFVGLLVLHLSFPITLIIICSGFSLPWSMVQTSVFGEEKNQPWLLLLFFLAIFLVFFQKNFKILVKVATLSSFATSFLTCCNYVRSYSDYCFKEHPSTLILFSQSCAAEWRRGSVCSVILSLCKHHRMHLHKL